VCQVRLNCIIVLTLPIALFFSHSKFPDDPDATLAFQKVALAYDVLSKPSSKRLYDAKASPNFEAFTPRPANYAEDTLRGVVLAAFNDFLEGDLEIVRTLLSKGFKFILGFLSPAK
jgi:curved DNA-binding protein CbpA